MRTKLDMNLNRNHKLNHFLSYLSHEFSKKFYFIQMEEYYENFLSAMTY